MNDETSTKPKNPVKEAFNVLDQIYGKKEVLEILEITREYKNVMIYRGYCPIMIALMIYTLSNGSIKWNTLLKPSDQDIFRRMAKRKKLIRKNKQTIGVWLMPPLALLMISPFLFFDYFYFSILDLDNCENRIDFDQNNQI